MEYRLVFSKRYIRIIIMKYFNKSSWRMATIFIVLIALALIVFNVASGYVA